MSDLETPDATETALAPSSVDPSGTHVSDLLGNPANLFNRLASLSTMKDQRTDLPAEVLHRPTTKKGRRGTVKLTEQILIGLDANMNGVTAAARAGGVTIATAAGYKKGSTEQGKKGALPHPELKPALDAALGTAKHMIADRILGSIRAIEMLPGGKVRGLDADKPMQSAMLASTLAGVVEKLSPKEGAGGNRVSVIVYGPEEREEAEYDRIDVALTNEEK
jgi:hypothetical protein